MRITLVKNWYPPHTGGGGVAVYNYYLAHALVKLGHRVTVVAARWSQEAPELADDEGVMVHRLLVEPRYWPNRIPIAGRFVRELEQLRYSFRVARKLRELESREPPDVVEFAEVGAEGFAYLLRSSRSPTVVRCHTPGFVLKRYHAPAEMNYDTRLTTAMEKYCIRHADALSAPSQDMAQCITHDCAISDGRIAVIPNALEVSLFASDPSRRSCGPRSEGGITVLHVGRLDRTKGIEVLAHAIPRVLAEVAGIRFVFLGEDRPDGRGSTWRQRLETYFREQGVSENVTFVGWADESALLDWYQEADIAVVPSILYESFSYTCAQAMAAGLPVVASRIGGIPGTVEDGVSGVLVAPGDEMQLARALIDLAGDEPRRRRMGKAGLARAQSSFDASVVARQTLSLYADTIRATKTSSQAVTTG